MLSKPISLLIISIKNFSQRSAWQIELVVNGQSGHGSRFFQNTPGEKMTRLLAKINAFRDEEQRKFAKVNYPYYGNITTINLTILRGLLFDICHLLFYQLSKSYSWLKGGVQYNVIPAEMRATFDMRNSIGTDLNEVKQQVSD